MVVEERQIVAKISSPMPREDRFPSHLAPKRYYGVFAQGSGGNRGVQEPSVNMAENNSPSGHRRKLSRVVRRLRVSGTCLMEKVLSTAAREDPLGRARWGVEPGGEGACVSGCRDWQNVSHERWREVDLASATRLPMANRLALRELPNILS